LKHTGLGLQTILLPANQPRIIVALVGFGIEAAEQVLAG